MNGEEDGNVWLQIAKDYIAAVERRADALRAADLEAVRVRHADLSARLEGFPQLFATKSELDSIKDTAQRLEKDSVSREVYDQNQQQLDERVSRITQGKLDASAFDAFESAYHAELRRALGERQIAADLIAKQTEAMRNQYLDDRDSYLTEETYEQRHQALVKQVGSVERWQYKLVGGLVFATFVAPIVSAVLVYIFTQRA